MQRYRVTAKSRARASSVYRLLLDGQTWPSWMGVHSVETQRKHGERRPPNDPDRVGDVRRIQTGRYVNHEEIVELVPDTRFRYTIVDGMLRGYKGDVTLTKLADGGTAIEWTASFQMSIPGAGWLMKLYLTRFMQRAVNNLARQAAQGG